MKYFLLLSTCLISLGVKGQNTFPNPGPVGIGTNQPIGQLQIKGLPVWDASTRLYLTNNASDYGRTNLILTGRIQADNDDWNFGSNARNSIVFAQNSANSGIDVGSVGSEKYSIQLEGNSNSLGFLSAARGTAPSMTLTQNGFMGIGTTAPKDKLDIQGSIRFNGNTPNFTAVADNAVLDYVPTSVFSTPQVRLAAIGTASIGADISFLTGTTSSLAERMHINSVGFVGIGTKIPDEKLTVKGKIHAEEVKVDLAVPGPDYVFEKSYDLKPLADVETFISQNKHLPEIPSAKTMKEEGINVGDMQMKLLQKVEEITLYLIELKNENTKLKDRVKELENKK